MASDKRPMMLGINAEQLLDALHFLDVSSVELRGAPHYLVHRVVA